MGRKKGTVSMNGPEVERLRIVKGWSREDLAQAAGCSLRTIDKVENGESVYASTLKAVADALEVETKRLVAAQEEPGPSEGPPEGGDGVQTITKVAVHFKAGSSPEEKERIFYEIMKAKLGARHIDISDIIEVKIVEDENET